MTRIILLTITAALIWTSWAFARQQELLNHGASIHMQEMEDASCDPSSGPSGGG